MGKLPARPSDSLSFLRELAEALRDSAERRGISAEERGRYARWLEQVAELEAAVIPANESQPAVLAAEYSDLPPALLKELSVRRQDQLGAQILAILRACGGSADLDQILIGLYRQYNTVQKRRFVQNKLWRMVRKGQIGKAKNRRNIFSLDAPNTKQSQPMRRLRRRK